MPVAQISDIHLQNKRLEEQAMLLDVFVDHCRSAKTDLIIGSGDWFEGISSPFERDVLFDFLKKAREICPVLGVAGNHDQAGEFRLFNKIWPDVRVAEEQRTATVGDYAIGFFPWRYKVSLVGTASGSIEETDRLGRANLAREMVPVSEFFRAAKAEKKHALLIWHGMIEACTVSTGQVVQGKTIETSPDFLHDLGADYVACGHIHKPQSWFDGRVAYAGSPGRWSHGEPESKGFRLIEFESFSNTFVELPAYKMLSREILIDENFEVNIKLFSEDSKNAHVKLVLVEQPGQATVPADDIKRILLEGGARTADVQTTSHRAEPQRWVSTATDLKSEIKDLLEHQGQEPEALERLDPKIDLVLGDDHVQPDTANPTS